MTVEIVLSRSFKLFRLPHSLQADRLTDEDSGRELKASHKDSKWTLKSKGHLIIFTSSLRGPFNFPSGAFSRVTRCLLPHLSWTQRRFQISTVCFKTFRSLLFHDKCATRLKAPEQTLKVRWVRLWGQRWTSWVNVTEASSYPMMNQLRCVYLLHIS